jgi:uncharacterized protein
VRSFFARLAASAVERPTQVVVAAVLLTLLGAIAALRLAPQASVGSLTDRGSGTYAATEELHRQFGDDPVVVMVRSDLQKLLLTPERAKLLALEGCLSGKAPGGAIYEGQPAPPPCAKIARLRPSFAVYGPATFLNQFAIRAQRLYLQQYAAAKQEAQAAAVTAARRAKRQGYNAAGQRQAALIAGRQILQNFQAELGALAVKTGGSVLPSFDNTRFVSQVVFDTRRAGGYPKPQFSSLFPSRHAALIYVRMRSDLSSAQGERAIDLYRAALAYPKFHLRTGSYVMSGVPVVASSLSHELSRQTFILLAVAMEVMAIALALVFGPPLRLLPLGLALAATAIAFGLLSLVGGSLTMAAIAVLPVLIGLAVDYAIQLQVRFSERLAAGSTPVRAAVEAAAAGGPAVATAAAATTAGFLVLLVPPLSPVPLVRTFALLLLIGVVVAFALAVTAGLAGLSFTRSPADRPRQRRASGPRPLARQAAAIVRLRRRLGERARAGGRRALGTAIAAPGRVLAVGAVLAIGGWLAGTQIGLVSDFRALLPRDLSALRGVDQIQRATGASGEVDVLVRARDLTDPKVVAWMSSFEQRVLSEHGFGGRYPSCRSRAAEICPAIALPDLFRGARNVTRSQIQAVIRLLPRYFAGAFIAHPLRPGRPDTTVIQFRVKALPFDRQKQLYDDMREQLDPPPGVTAQLAGLPVLFADASGAQSSARLPSALAAMAAVALVLLAAYRSARRALVPLIPIVLATGWSSLVLYLSGVPLNPLSATLGTLVIAIATEFSVILAARFEQERRAAGSVGEALRRAYGRTGAAVAASGVTATCGFAVLGVSDIRMLRDFGLVTVFDLAVALAGVLIVLPAALVWAEDGFPVALPRRPRRPRARSAPAGRWLPARLAARLARR